MKRNVSKAELDATLAKVREIAEDEERCLFTPYTYGRMDERNIDPVDAVCALRDARTCEADPKPDRWRIVGPDLDGNVLTLIVEIENDILVVTLWR